MEYEYIFILQDNFTGEEILTAEGFRFEMKTIEEALLVQETLNTGYVEQGEWPRACLMLKPALKLGGVEF